MKQQRLTGSSPNPVQARRLARELHCVNYEATVSLDQRVWVFIFEGSEAEVVCVQGLLATEKDVTYDTQDLPLT